jgi:hypothetical protein
MPLLRIIFGVAICVLLLAADRSPAQERITDQVAVTILRDQLYAATPGEGLVRVGLSSGEQVLASEARGLNALVLTSIRLLGFSAQVQRWSEQRTNLNEGIVERKVTSRLIMVRTDKRVFGFQGPVGRWKVEEFSLGEAPREMLIGEQVAVMLTDRRALGFSAFTGGFFPQDLVTDEAVLQTTINDNIAILSTAARRLIFRSQLGIWAEIR